MKNGKIRIVGGPNPLETFVSLDGKELRGVRSVRFDASLNEPRQVNTVTLELIPDEVEIEGYADIVLAQDDVEEVDLAR